jgi:hypothetical protein
MKASDPIYLELVDFVASGTTPQDVINLRPSAEAQRRVHELIERERESRLTPERSRRVGSFPRAGAHPPHGQRKSADNPGKSKLTIDVLSGHDFNRARMKIVSYSRLKSSAEPRSR